MTSERTESQTQTAVLCRHLPLLARAVHLIPRSKSTAVGVGLDARVVGVVVHTRVHRCYVRGQGSLDTAAAVVVVEAACDMPGQDLAVPVLVADAGLT